MTAKEYLREHSEKTNGMLIIGPIKRDSHYCIECFDNDGVLTKVEPSAEPYGWRCPEGHFGQGQRLATGGPV